MKTTDFGRRQRGLSMIELMVALLIGSLLTAAVLQMFIGSRTTYAMQNALAAMQENARFAMDMMARDLRKAGYTGCSTHTSISNTLRDGDNSDQIFAQYDLSAPVVMDDNYAATGSPVSLPGGAAPLSGSDVLSVRFADADESCVVKNHNVGNAVLRCHSNHGFQKGQILLVSDCAHAAVFQQSNAIDEGTTSKKIKHQDDRNVPGNCTRGLGLPEDCSSVSGNAYTFAAGSVVQLFKNYSYYLNTNDFGAPALYRSVIAADSGNAVLKAQELVEGVEDMQFTFGVDTDQDGDADYYVASDTNGDGSEDLDVTRVVAVRISLLMRSLEDNVLNEAQTYSYNGASHTATDRHLRKVFTTTVTLRNRVI